MPALSEAMLITQPNHLRYVQWLTIVRIRLALMTRYANSCSICYYDSKAMPNRFYLVALRVIILRHNSWVEHRIRAIALPAANYRTELDFSFHLFRAERNLTKVDYLEI